ncbi:MAG: lysophospholipid acyltransferase family protein [Bacteroidia bacterium]|nr:lysophospholipid acyltransferase family protein [Bacteroidia bacterium]
MAGENKKGIAFYLLYGAVNLIAMLPFGVLYLIADFLYVIVYYVVGYRRNVVRKNLVNSFPNKKEAEITRIEKKFYRHLCDYGVETIKMLRISDKEIRKRMVFKNPEVINRLTKDGNSCLLSLGHYGNWEWVPSIGLHLLPGVERGHVYKTLKSKAFDELFLRIRSRFSAKPIEMKKVYRTIIHNRNNNITMVIGFLSDQRPPANSRDIFWTTFLNQDTQVLTGMERIAQQMGFSVAYLDIKKVKRGHYVGNFSVISVDGSNEEQHSIMEKYTRKLEETILNEPAYYLWSHNKWSRKKQPKE